MPRLARVVAPGVPHHVAQRGNRLRPVFFSASDYHDYLQLLAEWSRKYGVAIWAYCLMPNQVHLIAVPPTEEALAGPSVRRGSADLSLGERQWLELVAVLMTR